MSNSENNTQDTKAPEKKKISLQDAMKQALAAKNQGKGVGKLDSNSSNTNASKKNPVTKKQNSLPRRTGGA
ncbi:MAG: hypothetical protein K0R93_613 [Anaerosolibacter sp.]|jgi:hypothetical protein|uniref:hypothetical protein n=1 Tax=Anaerosolibacter sp. TaxID=1872527 RepID=UPI00260C4C32|nr:hypothetical protein [Anaerosolibacter sp.]MDF2545715.1 hypothetical protein [Anaerosolibacter sp.]